MTKDNKFIPNTFQYPNEYIDRYMALLTPSENLVLTYAIRRIIGFHKQSDRISISQFTDGMKSDDGKPLDYGTGLGAAAVRKAVAGLVKYRIFKVVSPVSPEENLPAEIELQWDSRKVDLGGLQKRAAEKKAGNQKRTEAMREAPRSDGQRGVPPVRPTEAPRSDGQRGPGLLDERHNIPVENQKENQGKDSAAPPPDPPAPPDPDPIPEKAPTAQQAMVQALADVTLFDISIHGGRLGKTASKLNKAGYTPEQVEGLFSAGSIWYKSDWRGQRGDPPTPEQVSECIKKFMDPDFQDLKATPNGKPGTTFERNAQAAAEVRRKYGIQEDR